MKAIPYKWSLKYKAALESEWTNQDSVQSNDTEIHLGDTEDSSETVAISDQLQFSDAIQISILLIAIVLSIFVSGEEAEGMSQELLQAVVSYIA